VRQFIHPAVALLSLSGFDPINNASVGLLYLPVALRVSHICKDLLNFKGFTPCLNYFIRKLGHIVAYKKQWDSVMTNDVSP
jgi:hypothetical protein